MCHPKPRAGDDVLEDGSARAQVPGVTGAAALKHLPLVRALPRFAHICVAGLSMHIHNLCNATAYLRIREHFREERLMPSLALEDHVHGGAVEHQLAEEAEPDQP